MKTSFLTLFALTVLANLGAQAQQSSGIAIEKWRCFDTSDYRKEEILVTLSRDREHGEVSVAGVTYRADFRVDGFDRRWDFGEGLDYAFIIRPDGSGAYYDFSDVGIMGGKTSPSQFFECVTP